MRLVSAHPHLFSFLNINISASLVDSVLYKKVTSRVHAKITKSEANGIATLSIEDANAPNGTAVNFSRIRLSLLQ